MDFGVILMYVVSYFGLFTAIFFLLTMFENKKELKNPKLIKFPSITITVPAYNEEKTIAKTLQSLLNINYPKNKIEIIAIDDGSTDNTYNVAKQFVSKGVKVYKKKNSGKADSLNFALKRSKGEFFAALDADSFANSNCLKKMIGYFKDPKVMAVTPSLKVYNPKNMLQKIQYSEYLIGVFLRKVFAFLGSIHVTPGPLTIYRKSFFTKYGGYDTDNLTEDIEIALRIQKHHFLIENSVDASVYTVAPDKFGDLLKQRLRWYIGFTENVVNYRKLFHPQYGNLGMFVLPASFISVALVIVTLGYATYIFISKTIIQNFINLNSINFDFWKMLTLNLDTFYLNFSSLTFLAILSIFAGIIVILIAKRISKENTKLKFFYLFYLIFYWMLFGFWWIIAGVYTAFGKRVVWGQRR